MITLWDNAESVTLNQQCKQILQKGPLAYEYHPLKVLRAVDTTAEFTDKIKYSLVELDTEKLEFDLNHPVQILPQQSYDGSVNLILNDGKHYPKLINSRFSTTGFNQYQIVDREGDNDTNIYDNDKFEIQSSLYKKVSEIVKLRFLGLTNGGNFKVGNYHFYFKLADSDGNETDFVAESGLVTCHVGNINDPTSIRGGMEDENSFKGINFIMTNIDSAYNYVVVYYTRNSGTQDGSPLTTAHKIARKFSVINKTSNILLTGFDVAIDISIDEINMQYEIVDNAYTQEQCQNMLFLGNIQKPEIPYKELQDISLRFYPTLYTEGIGNCDQEYKDTTGKFEYYNVLNTYYRLGYWNDEIYRFGVVYIFNNGTVSPVFNILGVPETKTDTQVTKKLYKEINGESIRDYITIDKDNYQVYISEKAYNTKGVCRIKYTENQFDKETKAIGIKFKTADALSKITAELKKFSIKGLFFVRQKRIPTIFCQAVTVGLDNSSKTPVMPIWNKNELQYCAERFIDNERNLVHNFDERMYTTTSVLDSKAAICPEYNLRQAYFNQFFTVSEFTVQETTTQFSKNYLTRTGRHFYNMNYTRNEYPQEYKCVITGIADGIQGLKGKSQQFKAMAGSASEAYKISYIGAANRNTKATNIIRGLFSPYIGLEGTQKLGLSLVNIRIPNYDETSDYFSIRYRDASQFYSITDRIDIDDLTGETSAFRGDCFICNYSQRILRNFQDPETPINDQIIQSDTWKEHYSIGKNNSNESNTKINRADVNAVQLGHWITFKVCSNINLSLRCNDLYYPQEQGLTGNSRTFYPLSSMDTSGTSKLPESSMMNGGYNVTVSNKYFAEMPDVPAIKNVFNTRIMYSNIQINDAYRNNYRVFKTMDYRDYPITYGSLVKLVEWGGNLLGIFEHGVAVIAVNERAVAANGAGGNVFITANNVLPLNPYIVSTQFGTQWPESIVKTPYGLYGVDTTAKKLWKIVYSTKKGYQLTCISDFKLQRFLNENITLKEQETTPIIGIRNVKTHYKAFKGDVMFTFYDDIDTINERVWNICYNEILDKFITFYSWVPSFSTNIDNIFFSFDRNDSKALAKYYGDESFIKSKIVSRFFPIDTDNCVITVELSSALQYNNSNIVTKFEVTGPSVSWSQDNRFTITVKNDQIYTIPIKMTVTYPKEVTNQYATEVDIYYNNIVVCSSVPSQETYFWKHGQAGLMETIGEIKPCNWYGKQHPFEVEVIVNDIPTAHKIFTALQILSNKAQPESLHFEISGEAYNFAEDKLNMFFRQEAYKHLQQHNYFNSGNNAELISYDDRYLELQPALRPSLTNPNINQRSTYFPLYYKRIDKVDEIEDYYAQATSSSKDYQKMSGSEIVYDKLANQFNISTHMKATPYSSINENGKANGRLNGNMDYLEDKWLIQIPSINYRQKNENDWVTSDKGEYPKIVLSQLWPDESISLEEIPPQLKELYGNDKGIADIISTEDWKYAAETRLRDKFIKIKIRYKGDQLALIQALKTLYLISYA